MSAHMNRRKFLKTTAIGAGTALAFPYVLRGAEKKKLRIAIVGVGGRGGHGLGMARGEEITALCDTDTGRLAGAKKKFAGAKAYEDYREMFEKQKDYDAVIISTPDHQHYPPASKAVDWKIEFAKQARP